MSKRTILTLIIIPILLISGLIIVLVNNPREFTATLILAQQHIDFGTLPEWEGPVTRTVTAQNIDKNTLRIQSVHTGCNYIKITAPKQIRPAEQATFHIVLNPEILPVDKTTATATIFTNDLDTPSITLTIVAAAKRFATLNSDICDFGNIRPETTHQKNLKLSVNAPLDASDIRLLPSNHPELTWEITPDPNTDTAHLITIRLGPLKDRGHFASLLTVAFPNQRTLTLPVTAEVVMPVTAHPQTLIYDAVAPETQPSLEFTLSAETAFEVLEIASPAMLTVSRLNGSRTRKQHRMKVIWRVPNAPGPLREEIRVLTTADPVPIRIRIYGFVQKD